MRANVQQHTMRISIAHPEIGNSLEEWDPFVVGDGVRDADDFDGGSAESVAVLWRHDDVGVAHDTEF